jgi:anti-sigma factor RsiW
MTHVPEAELALYAGGELSGAEAIAVERHVAECAECRRNLEEIRRAGTWLKSVAVQPGAGEVNALRERVYAGQRRRVPLWAPAVAAVICVVFGVLLFRPGRVPSEPAVAIALPPLPIGRASAPPLVLPSPVLHRAVKAKHVEPRLTLLAHSDGDMPVVRVKTSDPNVVILWVVGGDSEQEKSNE